MGSDEIPNPWAKGAWNRACDFRIFPRLHARYGDESEPSHCQKSDGDFNVRYHACAGGCFKGLGFFTEQELRRLDSATFPEWVPNCSRRPDGYWGIKKSVGHKVIALEVELSVKADAEYELIARFYEERDGVHQILWVVRRASIAEKLHAIMQTVTRRTFKHSFLVLDPFYSLGWRAAIHCGLDAGNTVNQMLGNSCGTDRPMVSGQFSLDTRKTPHKSKH